MAWRIQISHYFNFFNSNTEVYALITEEAKNTFYFAFLPPEVFKLIYKNDTIILLFWV